MLDVKVIREKTEWVCARLAARNAGDEVNIQEIIALDDARRKNLSEVEVLRANRNKVSKEIGVLMAETLWSTEEGCRLSSRIHTIHSIHENL